MFSKKDLLRLIIPLILEQILGVAVGMVDVLMVSSVGESAISGVSLVDSINTLLFCLFAALCTGGAIISAHYLGSKDYKNACTAASQLILISTLIAGILSLVALLGNYGLLHLFFGDISADVMKNARTYFFVSAFSFPMIALYNANASLFRVMGNSKVSLYTSICANLIHVIGNAIFLYIFHMGVAGVAISTLISRAISALILCYLISKEKNLIHIDFKNIFHFNYIMIKKILAIGIPNGIESSIFQVGKLLVTGITVSFGTSIIAANAIAGNICSFPTIPGNAIGIALITVVGQTSGSGDNNKAKYYAKLLMTWGYGVMFLFNIVLFFGSPTIVNLYHLEAGTIPIVIQLLRYYSVVCAFIWPLAFALPNALRAVGEVKYTMVVSIASMWIWRIGFSYVLGIYFGMGILGVWIAMSLDWVCRAILFTKRFFYGNWQTRSVLDDLGGLNVKKQ